MTTHELKCQPPFYDAVVNGEKEFELRRNDRAYATGDEVVLREYDPERGYSGRQARATVGYLLPLDEVPGLRHASTGFVAFALVDVTAVIP